MLSPFDTSHNYCSTFGPILITVLKQRTSLVEAMDKPVMDESAPNDEDMEEPKKEATDVEYSHEIKSVRSGRRWTKTHSELAQPVTAAQIKPELDPDRPLQASLHAIVERIESLETLAWESKNAEAAQLQTFENLMVETVRSRRLEILCRYGDYLAERLEALRRYIHEQKLKTGPTLAEHWTTTAATLRSEEGKESQPCHWLIWSAADGLSWDKETTIFMVHEYATRNNLMHSELFEAVDRQQWGSIGRRCETDVAKLRELLIAPDADSKAAVRHWQRIIEELRDRWICPSEGGSTWEARPIIREAIEAGLQDRVSLSKLARLPEFEFHEEPELAIAELKEEKALGDAHRHKARQRADAALEAEYSRLEAKLERLEGALRSIGAVEDVVTSLNAEADRYVELEKTIKRYENRIKQL